MMERLIKRVRDGVTKRDKEGGGGIGKNSRSEMEGRKREGRWRQTLKETVREAGTDKAAIFMFIAHAMNCAQRV